MSAATALVDTGRRRQMMIALALESMLVVGEIVGGVLAHSSAVLANAGHDLADAVAIVFGIVAIRFALRSPTAARSFGYHRATILAALANLALLLVVVVLVAVEALSRLAHPGPVHGVVVAIIGASSIVVNLVAALVLTGTGDLNIRTASFHLAADAVAGFGVLVTGVVIAITHRLAVLDPALSLAIAVLVGLQGARLGRESLDILLESSPADLDLPALSAAVCAVEGVAELHDLHCWSLSSDVRALSAHLVLYGHPSLESAQLIGERVKAELGKRFQIAHATLELECESCVEGDAAPCAIEPSQRA